MDANSFFGGHPLGVALRLALISVAVGVVLKALGIDLHNFFFRLNEAFRTLYDLGFGAIDWMLEFLLLGALIVVPIWFLGRVISMSRRARD